MIVLIAGQGLMQYAFAGSQQLIAIRMLHLNPRGASAATGLAFAGLSLATVAVASSYTRVVPRFGFRRLIVIASGVAGLSVAAAALAPSAAALIAATTVIGAAYGVLNPGLASMLGLEAPSRVKATIFGINSSSWALGSAVGPLSGGAIAAAFGAPAGLYASAGALVLLASIMASLGREPIMAGV